MTDYKHNAAAIINNLFSKTPRHGYFYILVPGKLVLGKINNRYAVATMHDYNIYLESGTLILRMVKKDEAIDLLAKVDSRIGNYTDLSDCKEFAIK